LLAELISIRLVIALLALVGPPALFAADWAAVEIVNAPRASIEAITAGTIFRKWFIIFVSSVSFLLRGSQLD
jgi:hypothetical protein